MQKNSQLKFWKWAVILLTALNIFLLLSIWLKKNESFNEMHRPPNGEKAADFLIEQLKLSSQQMADFNQLKQVFRHNIDSVRDAGKELHHLFFDNLKTEKHDTISINNFAREIADNQTQIELITFSHFKKVRGLCDEKQKIKFDEIIQEVLKRMAAPNGKPLPPPTHNK